jgi:release factor glutamine methyltransferase
MRLFDDLLGRVGDAIRILPDKPEETPAGTLRALWFAAAGQPRSVELASRGDLPELTSWQVGMLRTLVDRRIGGEPLAYLTGRQRFLDLEMFAAPGSLIPRKETEIVGRAALGHLRDTVAERGSALVIDVCTGCGNLALAFAAHLPQARVLASDLSPEAVAVARENARVLGLEDRVDFRIGDLLAPFGAEFDRTVDVLTCNPPYISTAKVGAMPADIAQHEPSLAFDGGPFGIKILARVTKEALRLLRPGGWLAFELGLGQGPAMAKRLASSGDYGEIREHRDAAGEIRALSAQVRQR